MMISRGGGISSSSSVVVGLHVHVRDLCFFTLNVMIIMRIYSCNTSIPIDFHHIFPRPS